jgi:hypothetical protein
MQGLWRLAGQRPQLLMAHAAGYVGLIRHQGGVSLALLQRRAMLYLLAYTAFTMGVLLAGVALMLWLSMPALNRDLSWVFIAVPVVPIAVAGWAVLATQRLAPMPLWPLLREQWDADAAVLWAKVS